MFNLSESEIHYAAPGFCAVRQLPVFHAPIDTKIPQAERRSASDRKQEEKNKDMDDGMIFMIHRKPGFLNVKFVDKDFLCLKFSIANGIFRVNGKDWFLDSQIHHLRRPQSLLR